MSHFYNKPFKVGVVIGISGFAILNLFTILMYPCHNCIRLIGAPFAVYHQYVDASPLVPPVWVFFPSHLIANLMIVTLSSVGTGLLSRELWNWLATRRGGLL